tara:strand:- start:10003 stop:10434 length:432 start_codon:yes stop_codon:yes gene_type:complete
VTDWAVAPIPRDEPRPTDAPFSHAPSPGAPLGQLAVDDDPEDARAATRTEVLAPAREGDVLPREDVAPVADDDGDEDELDTDVRPDDAPAPPIVVPRLTPSGPETTARARVGGGQRYGEAVVRQVLGATFVREEPYDAPTRFA